MRIPLIAVVLVMVVSCTGKSGDNQGEGSAGARRPRQSAKPDAAKFAACTFITVKDAEALFGHPATQKQGPSTPRHGECDWGYDAPDNSSHLLQLNIWTQHLQARG